MFAAVLKFMIIKIQVFTKILELTGVCKEKVAISNFVWLQFQGLGKYKTIYVFVTQNVFGNNSRKKQANLIFCCFCIGSL